MIPRINDEIYKIFSLTHWDFCSFISHISQISCLILKILRDCLFVKKVDTLKFKKMKNYRKEFRSSLDRVRMQEEVFNLYRVQNLPLSVVMEKTGLGQSTIYRYISIFEGKNPEIAEQMRKRKDVTPEDYKKLQAENARLQSELQREKLRADFYEEMVSFGKEVYGIDLKKAGTK